MQNPTHDEIISTKDAAAITGIKPHSLLHAAKAGYGPVPVKLSRRCLKWNKLEVMLYAKHGMAWRDHITDD